MLCHSIGLMRAMSSGSKGKSGVPAMREISRAAAPIGAVVGEWVGSSSGLGYAMLHANGRMQTDLMFAALATLAVLALGLYFGLDALLRRALPWQGESEPSTIPSGGSQP